MGHKIVQSKNISGVVLRDLKQFEDENGKVLHALKNTEDEFSGFGEAYFSFVNKN